MLRNKFHWVEGIVVLVALATLTWMNHSHAAPDSFGQVDSYSSQAGSSRAASNGEEDGQVRMREGTEIDGRTGYFRQDGDGATFVTDDGFELGGLPNLNLQRVIRTLKTADENKTIRWRVNGTVTEFSGRNYLFITRAVYKSTAPPPVPVSLIDVEAKN